MANIPINAVPTRRQYTATASQTVFSYTFPIKTNTDLRVYKRAAGSEPDDVNDLLTLTTDYTVTGANTADGGTVVLVVGATAGDIVTIVGDKPVDRTAIYDQSVTLKKADLNNDFNDNVMFQKQTNTLYEMLTPSYRRSELIFRDLDNPSNNVRADNLYLPILNDGYIWVGRGNFGDNPDDIQAQQIGNYDSLGLLSADFVVGTAQGALPNAQVLGGQGTGIMYSTDAAGTGTVSILGVGDGLSIVGGNLVVTDANALENQVTQYSHGLTVGTPIRVQFDGTYVAAQADNPTNAAAVGIVSRLDADNPTDIFYWKQIGDIDLTGAAKNYLPLTVGDHYMLDPTTAGELTNQQVNTNGQVRKFMLVATGQYTGIILHYIGLIVGSNPDYTDGGGGDNDGPDAGTTENTSCDTPTILALTQGVWTDLPCLTDSITTTSNDSFVEIEANIIGDREFSAALSSLYIRVVRDSTVIGNGIAQGSEIECYTQLFQDNTIQPISLIDFPGATGTYTYKFQVMAPSANVNVYLQRDYIYTMAGNSNLVLTELV